MRESYIPLHGHSTYSFGDGVTRIPDIVARTKEIGADAVALTEHGNMASFLKFWKECKEQGVKPILGCELYINDLFHADVDRFKEAKKELRDAKRAAKEAGDDSDEFDSESNNNHFLAYCRNYEGVKNLIRLSNMGFENFYRKPLVSTEMIWEQLDDNNIITTGCIQSRFNQLVLQGDEPGAEALIKKFADKFGDNFYLEVQLNELDMQAQVGEFYHRLWKRTGLKPVFALDYHYANKDDWFIQYLLYVIKQRQTVESYPPEDWFYTVRDLFIKDIDYIYEQARKYGMDEDFLGVAIDNTFEIRDKVDIEIPKYPDNFPKFTDSAKESKDIFLTNLREKFKLKLEQGLIPEDQVDEYMARIKYEAEIIISKDMVDYFLILDDILTGHVYATGGATGAGRGSAGGSLVLFVLDITKIDPIKHNLIFERFMNPARIDPADIDMDIDSDTQKGVEGYLKERYGLEKVCHIANFGKFGAKTIVKDLCRVFSLDFKLSNELTGLFDTLKSDLPIADELDRAYTVAEKQNNAKLMKFISEHREMLVELGDKMLGMVRQVGRHASGILVCNTTLNTAEIPVIHSAGELVTGVQEGGDEREVGELGYCKLDILGLNCSSITNEALKFIEAKHGIKDLEMTILTGEFDDEQVYDEFYRGNCRDIFQFGSDSMINLIRQVQPKSIDDLAAINALFRPAVIYAGGIDDYLGNKADVDKAKAHLAGIHPKLWEILEETYGVPCFQEQIMFILQQIGGFSLAEADDGRKTLKLLHKGNQDKNDRFLEMLAKFKKGAKEAGIEDSDLDWLLDIMGKYSEYSFNKSHSLAYAMNAYVSMYLKIHYPLEYYAALLNHSTNEDLSWFIKQAISQGVEFGEFKMGEVSNRFEVDYDNDRIIYGLHIVKGISSNDIDNVVELNVERPLELVEMIHEKKIGKRSYQALCRLGFFSAVTEKDKLLLEQILECKSMRKRDTYKSRMAEATKAFEGEVVSTQTESFAAEKELLQFYISEHPFKLFVDRVNAIDPSVVSDMMSPKQAPNDLADGTYMLYGLVSEIQIKKSKKTRREYYKVVLEDDEQSVFVTFFNTYDVTKMNIGDVVIIPSNKSSFGFAKESKGKVVKIDM